MSVDLLRDGAKKHLLYDAQHIKRAQNDAHCRADRLHAVKVPELIADESPRDHHELSDETVRSWEANACERRDEEKCCVYRHDLREATKLRDVARVPSIVEHSDKQEE